MNNLNFLKNIKIKIEKDIDKIIMKYNINDLIKIIFLILEDSFNPYNPLEVNKFFSKEQLAEELSYIVHRKVFLDKKKFKLKDVILNDCIKFHTTNKDTFEELINLLEARNKIRDMEIYIEKQSYELVIHNNILKLEHPIKNFQHYNKLGYLRNMVESINLGFKAVSSSTIELSDILKVSTENESFKILDYEKRREGTKEEAIIFKLMPEYIANLTKYITSSHELKANQLMHKYLDNAQFELLDNCTKKGKLKWVDILNLSIVLEYISHYITKTIREKSTSQRMAINSKLLLMTNQELLDFFMKIFINLNDNLSEKEVKNFLGRFTIDILNKEKRIDLQFNPIVKMDTHSIVLFNVFSTTDIARAYINNSNYTLDGQGTKFEDEVFKRLKIGFQKIYTNIQYKDNNIKGEIDICTIGNNNIYFIECKNNIHPISASSSSNNYTNIIKSKEQLEQSERYFNKDRNEFIKKHLKINNIQIDNYKLYKITILSNRNGSGLNYNDISYRDIYSLDRLLTKGSITKLGMHNKKEEVIEEISLYKNKKTFQEIDFINYISEKSIFFNELNKIAINMTHQIKYQDYHIEHSVFSINMLESNKTLEKNL